MKFSQKLQMDVKSNQIIPNQGSLNRSFWCALFEYQIIFNRGELFQKHLINDPTLPGKGRWGKGQLSIASCN